ncbi:unnamed protein product, partial [marine sediment metagenome]
MTLTFIESFNGISDELHLYPKWINNGGLIFLSVAGRFGESNGAVRMLTNTYHLLAPSGNIGTTDKCIVGFAYKPDIGMDETRVMAFWDGGVEMLKVVMNTDGTLDAVVDTTVVSSTTEKMKGGVWRYIEIKVLFHASAGTVDWQIDGVSDGGDTGKDTIYLG